MTFKLLLSLLVLLLSHTVFSANYIIDTEVSKLKWHLFVSSSTDVYGEIPVSGNLNTESGDGKLIFSLNETKSYEMNQHQKDYNTTRDSRIYDITGATKNAPIFKIIKINGNKIVGNLNLNGQTKKVEIDAKLVKDGRFLKLKAKYKLDWADYGIGNPVVWIMRVAKTADQFVNLDFDLTAKQ